MATYASVEDIEYRNPELMESHKSHGAKKIAGGAALFALAVPLVVVPTLSAIVICKGIDLTKEGTKEMDLAKEKKEYLANPDSITLKPHKTPENKTKSVKEHKKASEGKKKKEVDHGKRQRKNGRQSPRLVKLEVGGDL